MLISLKYRNVKETKNKKFKAEYTKFLLQFFEAKWYIQKTEVLKVRSTHKGSRLGHVGMSNSWSDDVRNHE